MHRGASALDAEFNHLVIFLHFLIPLFCGHQSDCGGAFREVPSAVGTGNPDDGGDGNVVLCGSCPYLPCKFRSTLGTAEIDFAGCESVVVELFETLVYVLQIIDNRTDGYLLPGLNGAG